MNRPMGLATGLGVLGGRTAGYARIAGEYQPAGTIRWPG